MNLHLRQVAIGSNDRSKHNLSFIAIEARTAGIAFDFSQSPPQRFGQPAMIDFNNAGSYATDSAGLVGPASATTLDGALAMTCSVCCSTVAAYVTSVDGSSCTCGMISVLGCTATVS